MSDHSWVPDLYFDGQFVDVLWDNYDKSIEWFEKYFGWSVAQREDWTVDPACEAGQMTRMNYGTWVVTYKTEEKLAHHFVDRDGPEPNIRLCFRVHDLEKMHKTFAEDNIKTSSIYDGPKARYFDVWGTPENIRLTLQEDQSVDESGVHPSWVRIGVRDLGESIQWYQAHTGMRLVERDPDDRFAVMALKLNHAEGEESLWVLERLPEGAHTGKINGHVRPVCWIKSRDDFFKYNEDLKSRGVDTADVGGFVTRGMVSFHFYDPDGNRFNVSSM